MQSRWALPGRSSAAQPPSSASEDAHLPLPFPPDPPDPIPPFSPHLFPPLDSTPPPTRSECRRNLLTSSPTNSVMTNAQSSPSTSVMPGASPTTQFGSLAEINAQITVPATGNPNPTFVSASTTSLSALQDETVHPSPASIHPQFITIQPNHNSPLISNRASGNPISLTPSPPALPANPIPLPSTTQALPSPSQPPLPPKTIEPSLVESLRLRGDKSLQRLAPVTISETGRPRVLIPDSVFEKGAELHRDFIICYFNGRPPPQTKNPGKKYLVCWGLDVPYCSMVYCPFFKNPSTQLDQDLGSPDRSSS